MTVVLVLVRVLVAAVLVAGPWTDDAAELDGWDVERFEAIAGAPGRAWRDHPVEYPPGSVAVIALVAGDGPVNTHRRLAVAMLVLDLAVAAALTRFVDRRAAGAWLALGLLLLPAPYLRLDLLAAALALLAVVAVERRRPGLAGVALTAGAMVKVWPALLVAAWLAARHWRAVSTALVTGAAAALAWLAWAGTDAPAQVLGYRGATGWHVESGPGVLAGFGDPGPAAIEQGAFRWGHAGLPARLALLAVLAATVVAVVRRASPEPVTQHLAGATLVAALLVTSPLLSPQYLCWLLPFAALAWADGERSPAVLTAAAALLTTGLLAVVGPDGAGTASAQWVLLARNLTLVLLVAVGLARLGALRGAPSGSEDHPPVPAR